MQKQHFYTNVDKGVESEKKIAVMQKFSSQEIKDSDGHNFKSHIEVNWSASDYGILFFN